MRLQQSFRNRSTMKLLIFLFLYLSVFQTFFVESGFILDKFKSGVDTTKKTVKCGVQKFSGFLTQGKVVSCQENNPDEKTNEIDPNAEKDGDEVTTIVVNAVNEKATEKLTVSGSATAEKGEVTKSVEVVSEQSTKKSDETDPVTVPGGRRVITVGANCPEGYRGDGKGNCREEY